MLFLILITQFIMEHVQDAGKIGRHRVLLVAAADSSEGLPPTIRRCFSHEISMGPLTEEQRVKMVSQSLQTASELLSNVCEQMCCFSVPFVCGFYRKITVMHKLFLKA